MLLSDYASAYIQERPGLTEGYRSLLRATVYKFGAWSGRRLTLAEVDRPLLAGWAESLLATDRPATINKKVRLIRTLLMSAYDAAVWHNALTCGGEFEADRDTWWPLVEPHARRLMGTKAKTEA